MQQGAFTPQVARQRHGPCSLLPRRLRLQTRKAFHLPQQQTSPGLSVVGVIYSSCITVAEYRALPRWRRGAVRSIHNPIVANLLLPPVLFILLYRTPFDAAKGWQRERNAVYLTNVALAALFGGLGLVPLHRRIDGLIVTGAEGR